MISHSFLRKLFALGTKPDAIILYNSGVKLLADGSSVLDAMEALFKAGVDIIACGTCVVLLSTKCQNCDRTGK